jgi:hypothetical protein
MDHHPSCEGNSYHNQLILKFPSFNGMWKFNTTLTRTCHWSLSSARWIQYITSHPIPLRSILLILSSRLQLGLQNGFISSGFLTKTLHIYFSPLPCTSHGLTHLTSLIVIISHKQQYYESPHYAVFSVCLLLCSAYVPAFSSAPCSQTPSCTYFKIWSESLHAQ